MSREIIRYPTIIPQDEWVEKQKDIQLRENAWQAQMAAHKKGLGPRPEGRPPRYIIDPETGKPSLWLQWKTFGNYDETRFGPDPIDTVIDRLGIFEGLDFQAEIKHAEEKCSGPIGYGGASKATEKSTANGIYNDAEKAGLDLTSITMFDGSKQGPVSKAISEFIGADYNKLAAQHPYEFFHIQRPGQMLMYHYDVFYNLMCNKDPELAWKPDKIKRFAIFMEDWKPGHIWIAGNTTYSHWKAGECITWNWQDIPHGTANLHHHNRYSLHLTGYMTEKSWEFYNNGNKDTRYVWNENKQTFDVVQPQ